MLRSLLHYQSSIKLSLIGLTALTLALEAYADNDHILTAPRTVVMNIGTLSSEDLMLDADQLSFANNPLDEGEMNQHQMNSQWLEAGITEAPDYIEGNDALEELAESALKYYWNNLVERDQSYNLYTPVVEGNYTASRSGADFGVRLSGNTLKLRVEYTF